MSIYALKVSDEIKEEDAQLIFKENSNEYIFDIQSKTLLFQ